MEGSESTVSLCHHVPPARLQNILFFQEIGFNGAAHSSGGSRSAAAAMSVFGQSSIDVRPPWPGKSRRRAAVQHKNSVPEVGRAAKSGVGRLHRRAAMAEEERVSVGDDRSRRPELQGTRAVSGRRKKGLVGVGAHGGARPQQGSSALCVELMEELVRARRELRELQHEVKVEREAKGKGKAVTGSASLVAGGSGMERRDAKEGRVVVDLELAAGAGRSAEETTRMARIGGLQLQRDTTMTTTTSRAAESSDLEASGLTAVSFATARNDDGGDDESSEGTAITTTEQEDHEASLLRVVAAVSELDSARIELESIRAEGLRFTTAMERTREETARVTDEIRRLAEQEKKVGAQVQQLHGKLLNARSKLEAVTAAGEAADGTLSSLKATVQKLEEETEAAEKEKALTEQENRCVVADMESIDAEIAAAEQRIRESFRELEAARTSESAATEKLKAVIESARRASAAVTPQRSGNVTIPRFEYEYLTGRAEEVRSVADKKMAAAEAWVKAWCAGEKEMTMRAKAIERVLGEAEAAAEVEVPAENDQIATEAPPRPRDGRQRAHPSKRPARENGASSAVTPRRKKTAVRNNRRLLLPNYLKLISGKCTGRN